MWVVLFRLLGWLAKTFPYLAFWIVHKKTRTAYLAARMVIGDEDLPEI